MSIKSILALVAVVVIGLVVLLMNRLGSFKPVDIRDGQHAAMKVVYKHHVGAYHTIMAPLTEVETWAKATGEGCAISFGEFIDDPDKIAEDRLRSNAGCVVLAKPTKQMPDGFFYREIPAHRFVIAEFDGAPSIGPIKVYPRAHDEIEKSASVQSGPTFELYEIRPNEQVHTTYLFPVVKAGEKDSSPVGE